MAYCWKSDLIPYYCESKLKQYLRTFLLNVYNKPAFIDNAYLRAKIQVVVFPM